MEKLFGDGAIERSRFREHNYSDFMRMLFLYKFGGLYMDLDVITTRSFDQESFPRSFGIFQSGKEVNNAILKFEKHSCLLKYHIKNMVLLHLHVFCRR